MGAGEHTRVSGMGPPVATRFSGNRGVLSVPYRRLFAGRLEAIPGAAYIDKKYPTGDAHEKLGASRGAPHSALRAERTRSSQQSALELTVVSGTGLTDSLTLMH